MQQGTVKQRQGIVMICIAKAEPGTVKKITAKAEWRIVPSGPAANSLAKAWQRAGSHRIAKARYRRDRQRAGRAEFISAQQRFT